MFATWFRLSISFSSFFFFWVSLKGCKVSGSIRTLRDFSSHGNLAYAKRGICLQTDGHRHSQTQPFVLHSGEQEAYTFFCLGGSQYLTCNIYFSSSFFFFSFAGNNQHCLPKAAPDAWLVLKDTLCAVQTMKIGK